MSRPSKSATRFRSHRRPAAPYSSRTTGAPSPVRPTTYGNYIKSVAEPIDENARRAGVFEEVRTVTPAPGTTTDWTHLRIFRLKNAAAAEALGAGLDAATARVVPDEAQRKANSERSAGMRDLVRREVWTELR